MSTSQVLQQLYSLDITSPTRRRGTVPLQSSELVRLVDFLDEVRTLPSAVRPVTERILQALGAIPTTDDVFRQCLRKLHTICGHHITLPSLHSVRSYYA